MHPSVLFNNRLFIHAELIDQLPRIEALIRERPLLKGIFLEQLMLYDKVIVPTPDLSIAPVLSEWLGEGLLTEILGDGALRFLRCRDQLGYAGNGVGLCLYRIGREDGRYDKTRKEARMAETADAADAWLRDAAPSLDGRARGRLVAVIDEHTEDVLELPEFQEKIAHETYMDALNSPSLRTFFGIRSHDMTRLSGTAAGQLRAFSPQAQYNAEIDEIDVLLRMAAANFELHLAEVAQADDVEFDPSIQRFLVGKAERALHSIDLAQGFVDILSVNDLPDMANAVGSDVLSPAEVWRIRSGENGIRFRRWFHEHVREQPDRAVNEYVAAIGKQSWVSRFPGKVLRFLVTNAASLLPPVGIAASAIDSFLLDRIVRGYSPKYLIDDLRQILPPPARTADPAHDTDAIPRSR